MVDADVLEDLTPPAVPSKGQVLSDLLLCEDAIELYRYADGGPTDGVEPVAPPPDFLAPERRYDGWAVVQGWDSTTRHGSVVYSTGPDEWSVALLMGNAVEIAADDESSGCYQEMDSGSASARRHADELAAVVADQGIEADIYVTRRPYLFTDTARRLNRELTTCTPEEALPLIGLYLRARNHYFPLRRLAYSRHLFFWVATREILPNGWRWFGGVVAHDDASGESALTYLAQSAFQRVLRALEARDSVLVAMNRPQNRGMAESALSNVETMLLFLMGAVDVIARVAHRVLGINGDEYLAHWQHQDWLKKVMRVAPRLADVVGPRTPGRDALTILRLLRNSVHGEALRGLSHQRSAFVESLIGLPQRDEERVLEAIEALGGLKAWSVRRIPKLGTYADPGTLADMIFRYVVVLIDGLMANTPVERLEGVKPSELKTEPPQSDPASFDPFSLPLRRAIRYQLGLDLEPLIAGTQGLASRP